MAIAYMSGVIAIRDDERLEDLLRLRMGLGDELAADAAVSLEEPPLSLGDLPARDLKLLPLLRPRRPVFDWIFAGAGTGTVAGVSSLVLGLPSVVGWFMVLARDRFDGFNSG